MVSSWYVYVVVEKSDPTVYIYSIEESSLENRVYIMRTSG